MHDPSTLTWGIKRIDPDLTTGRNRDGAEIIRWPVQSGGWVEHPDADRMTHETHGGASCGVGLHVARSWRAASLGGCLTSALCVIVGWHGDDVMGPSAGDKVRVRRCYVVPGAIDGFVSVVRAQGRGADLRDADLWGADLRYANLRYANVRDANLWGADLRGADLWGANLGDADLWGANLCGANLWGANLWDANLRGANLGVANLWGANLRDANLWGANLRDADLGGANLRDANLGGANLWGAKANSPTVWPDGFDPKAAGVIL